MKSPRAAFPGTVVLLGLALGTGATPAAAQSAYPNRAIRMVVDTSPGGLTDILGRVAAEGLAQQLGRQVVVENKAGASGNVAIEFVVKSPADGYTLMIGAGVPQERRAAPSGSRIEAAPGRAARRADIRGGGTAGLGDERLVRHLRAERHRPRNRAPAERQAPGGDPGAQGERAAARGRSRAARRPGAGVCRARARRLSDVGTGHQGIGDQTGVAPMTRSVLKTKFISHGTLGSKDL